MRTASGRETPSRFTALRTQLAMSMLEPARRPSSSMQTLPETVISRPSSLKERASVPTLGMASVTNMKRFDGLQRIARRRTTGEMCWPSTMMPHQLSTLSSAAPTTPGSRPVSCDMALNRCVKPVRP